VEWLLAVRNSHAAGFSCQQDGSEVFCVAVPARDRRGSHQATCWRQGRTVVILGWLGSQNDEFADIAQYYRQTYPDARIVTSVGGCDRCCCCCP
jgi:hypothetical protein